MDGARNQPAIEYIEILLDVVAPFINVYFLFLLRRPFFHLNLRIMLANFSLSLIALTTTRLVLFFLTRFSNVPFEKSFWLHVVHNGTMFIIMNATIWMALERLLATVLAKVYEKMRLWILTLILCAFVCPSTGSIPGMDGARNQPAIEYIEILLDVVAPFINVYFLFLLRRPFFHLNLRIMLANFSFSLIALTTTRLVLLFLTRFSHIPFEKSFWLHVVHNGTMFIIMNATIWMALERLLATVLARVYEKMRLWILTLILCAFVGA
uniref:Serpentine receptor class gamma n=1 Tax=Steinernema glaseri TaxID=37863 RepID=A0A1I8A1F0_9BILA